MGCDDTASLVFEYISTVHVMQQCNIAAGECC